MRREGKLFFCLAMALTLASCTSTAGLDEPTQEVLMETPEASVVPTASPTMQPATTVPASPTPSLFDIELPVGEVDYQIPLNIRHVTENSATLFFELDTPSKGYISVKSRDEGALPFTVPLDSSQVRHIVTANNLVPGTTYDALIALEEDESSYHQPGFLEGTWGPVSFHTRTKGAPLRIGVIGDASFGDKTTIGLVDAMTDAKLDFVIHTGDVVDRIASNGNPFDSYKENFYSPFEPLLKMMPMYTVPGNHDYDRDISFEGGPFYFHAFPAFFDPQFPAQKNSERNQFYAVPYGEIQFVMLDTQVLFGQPGREDQESWLEERLSDPRFEVTIPVFHVPPYNSSTVHPDDSNVVRGTWVSKFKDANVLLTLSGHYHAYERLIENDITYIITSGGSSVLYAKGDKAPESQLYKRESHYLLIELENESLSFSAINLDGDVLDEVTIPLEP